MRFSRLFAVLLLAVVPVITVAKEKKNEPVGPTTITPSSVSWAASGDHDSLELTVQNEDGETWTSSHRGAAVFNLRSLGSGNVDGRYTYELRVVPRLSASVKSALTAARNAGDDKEVARLMKQHGLNKPVLQSGALMVLNGAFVLDTTESDANDAASRKVTSDGPGEVTTNDTVIPDDLIVTGSLCVGFDCVDGEAFGFDTIKMKENNTRLKFEDTSTSAGFPTGDWQLTANDSASGGAEKFSVDDVTNAKTPFTIEGNSPTAALYVDSTGNIGFSQSAPVLDLHITTNNTPAMRLEQNNTGGFTAQTWDIGANEANFFVRDVTGGSRLPFRIRPGAPTSSIDVAASGNVGIGTASPVALLDVRGTSAHVLVGSGTSDFLSSTQVGFGASNGTEKLFFGAQSNLTFLGSNSNTNLAFVTNNSTRAVLDTNGFLGIGTTVPTAQITLQSGGSTSTINAGASQFTVSSSRTFKENIEPVKAENILNKIESVPVVTYDFKNDGPKDRMGLIAEDFHNVFGRGNEKYIDGHEVQMALWLAVQQLTAENKALMERLNQLEKQVVEEKQ